jgi:hypothetical protein
MPFPEDLCRCVERAGKGRRVGNVAETLPGRCHFPPERPRLRLLLLSGSVRFSVMGYSSNSSTSRLQVWQGMARES